MALGNLGFGPLFEQLVAQNQFARGFSNPALQQFAQARGLPDPFNRAIDQIGGFDELLRAQGIQAAGAAQGAPFATGPTSTQQQLVQQLLGLSGSQDPRLQQFLDRAQGGAAANFGLGTRAFSEEDIEPFRTALVDPLREEFAHQGDLLQRRLQQEATQRGAFGGSRQAVAEATGQADLGRQAATAIGSAQDRATQLASQAFSNRARNALLAGQTQFGGILPGIQFGQGADLQNLQAGLQGTEFLRGLQQRAGLNPFFQQMAALQALQGGRAGTETVGGGGGGGAGSAIQGGLGGALTGFGIGGPLGGAIGGGLGILGGLF